MTRWVRAGSTQKHKKMPGDATKWGEFDHQKANESLLQQQRKIKSGADINQNEKSFSATDFSASKIESNEKCEADVKLFDTQEKINSQKKSFLEQKVSVKKLKNKRKTVKQNVKNTPISGLNDKSSVTATKVFEKKKDMYLEKLKKKRAENGITLLSSKIERKLYIIKKKLREKRVPPAVIKDIIRKERRKEELKFRNSFNPSKRCFNCRQAGHVLADCPVKLGSSNQETGICFKCGAAEHTSFKCPEKVQGFPFAKCFICKEQGHISKDCPKNKHGVYPKGGRCTLCGNVNHLRKDCPSLNKKEDNESTITLHTINEETSIDAEVSEKRAVKEVNVKKLKIVKF